MADLKMRNGTLRGVKIALFFVFLLLFVLTSLVLVCLSPMPEEQAPFSAASLLDGTYLEKNGVWSGLIQRDVLYDNQIPPQLLLKGDGPLNVEVGGAYIEPGFFAQDARGVELNSQVESHIEGDKLLYTVTDSRGNSTHASRPINYVDTTPPEITLLGGPELHLIAGTVYEEPGFTAVDNADGDVTADVLVSGTVEKYRLGIYPITYTVCDSLGNQTVVTRQVHIEAASQPEQITPGGRIIYLTFDDGPGPYTDQLLEILNQYGVKVTFFVTNQFPDYQDMIAKAASFGHSVAIHTYDHDFAKVYASEDAYFEDLNQMQAIIVAQTGQETSLVRFPGGSSNTISANYCEGIMTTLAADLEAMGYQYFDWNVSSGDAGETTDTGTVAENVLREVQGNGDEPSIVLLHDIHDYSVNAVEQIILWGLENGYTFMPLDSTSPAVHHPINN